MPNAFHRLKVLTILASTLIAGCHAASAVSTPSAPHETIANVHAPSVKSAPPADDSPKEYKQVRLAVGNDKIVFANDRVELRFDRKDGAWSGLFAAGSRDNMISAAKPGPAIDFRIDNVWMIETGGSTFLKHEWAADEKTDAVTLKLTYGVVARPKPISFIPQRWNDRVPNPIAAYAPASNYEYELAVSYTLHPGSRQIERSATLTRNLSKDFFHSSSRHHDGFLFVVPNAVIADPKECTVEVPGPPFTYTFIDAGTPYNKLAGTFIDCKTTPDRLPGIVGFENKSEKLSLSTWLDTKGEVAYETYLSGDGKRISVLFHSMRSERLADRATIQSDTQYIQIADTFANAQTAQRETLERSMPLSKTTPAWAREMVILEIIPGFYPGGFKGITEHLPFYADIGFNAMYLLPHWKGGYSPIDPFEVDPAQGTKEDLQALVKRAHELGIRVLFDMVIHGINPESPVVKEHPEIFTHDENGLLETHYNWGTVNTDPFSKGYQKYMVDLVLHDLKEYDIDGYRIDAASYKSPNWDPKIDYKPWQASSTIPLFRAMYDAMQKQKHDVVLYTEMFGPAFHTVSNLVQDANWAVVTDVFEQFDKGEIDAATYKAGMAQLQASMQHGVNRIRFCRNHDTSWFFPKHYKGFTDRFLALDTVHILFGVPVVFAGDRNYPPSLEDEPRAIAHYKRIFALKKKFPEFSRGEVLLREVQCDNDWIFTGLRKDGDKISLAVISLSDKPQKGTIHLTTDVGHLAGATLTDPVDGSTVNLSENGAITVEVKPFQTFVGRLP